MFNIELTELLTQLCFKLGYIGLTDQSFERAGDVVDFILHVNEVMFFHLYIANECIKCRNIDPYRIHSQLVGLHQCRAAPTKRVENNISLFEIHLFFEIVGVDI